MSKRPSQFARYPWFVEHGIDLIHPDDLADFKKIMPGGKVFGYSDDGDWIILNDGAQLFRVREKLLIPVPQPRFWIGDCVGFTSGGEAKRGVVRTIMWHSKEKAPFFLLSSNDKRLSKRYFENDLDD